MAQPAPQEKQPGPLTILRTSRSAAARAASLHGAHQDQSGGTPARGEELAKMLGSEVRYAGGILATALCLLASMFAGFSIGWTAHLPFGATVALTMLLLVIVGIACMWVVDAWTRRRRRAGSLRVATASARYLPVVLPLLCFAYDAWQIASTLRGLIAGHSTVQPGYFAGVCFVTVLMAIYTVQGWRRLSISVRSNAP